MIEKTLKQHWEGFKTDVYPDGLQPYKAKEIERAFHGGVLIGLIMAGQGMLKATDTLANIRKQLDEWSEEHGK